MRRADSRAHAGDFEGDWNQRLGPTRRVIAALTANYSIGFDSRRLHHISRPDFIDRNESGLFNVPNRAGMGAYEPVGHILNSSGPMESAIRMLPFASLPNSSFRSARMKGSFARWRIGQSPVVRTATRPATPAAICSPNKAAGPGWLQPTWPCADGVRHVRSDGEVPRGPARLPP